MTDSLLKKDPVTGKLTRIMNAEEIKERQALNVANTASSLIRRAQAELASRNGRLNST